MTTYSTEVTFYRVHVQGRGEVILVFIVYKFLDEDCMCIFNFFIFVITVYLVFRQTGGTSWNLVQLQYYSQRAEDFVCHFEGCEWEMGEL